MRCIFCKNNSSTSISIEHIVPESLGNTEYILPKGIVCDACNNYFSREVEKPVLEDPFFTSARFSAKIYSKKGRIPAVYGFHLESLTPVTLCNSDGEGISIGAAFGRDEKRWISSLRTSEKGTLIFPAQLSPNKERMSRFLAKVGIEALAARLLHIPGGIDELVNKKELDELRNYARNKRKNQNWPFAERRIYTPDHLFIDPIEGNYQVIHEWDFLYTPEKELYFVCSFFGVEFAINMGGNETSGYEKWLSNNSFASPLYPKGVLFPPA